MNEKLSFKVPLDNREIEITVDINDETKIDFICVHPTLSTIKSDSSIYEMFKSIVRKTPDVENKIKLLEDTLDSNQILDLIDFIMKQLALKKNIKD